MPANSQYIPLKNEYILHTQLNIYCIRYTAYAYGYILHRQMQYYCVFNSVRLANCGHALLKGNKVRTEFLFQPQAYLFHRNFHTGFLG